MKRAAGYVRVSSKVQAEKGESLETQRKSTSAYLMRNGTAVSLNEGIIAIEELREMVIENQLTAALDETCSADSYFSKGAGK